MIKIYMQVGLFNSLKLKAQIEFKVQKSRGYAPGLAWIKYNQKLVFASSDHPPSSK